MVTETTAETESNIVQTETETVGGNLEVTFNRFRDGTVIVGLAKWDGAYAAFSVRLPLEAVLKIGEMIQRLPAATPTKDPR